MTATHAKQLVDGYLGRLELELLDLAPERRREIVDDIRAHIADERGSIQNESDADLLNVLDRLGDPAEIAAAAKDGQSVSQQPSLNRAGLVEVLALVLTPFIWPAGVILLWMSPAWTTRQKLLGTLVPPGGYPGLFLALEIVFISPLRVSGGCSTSFDAQGNVMNSTCTPDWVQVVAVAASLAIVIVALSLPVVVGIYLATRLRSRATA